MDAIAEKRQKVLQERERQEAALREREKKSPYRDFAQLNRKGIPHLDRACRDNPAAVRVLLFILQHMDRSNAFLCPYKVFEEYLDLSQATVARSLKYLKDKGFIAVERRPGVGNVYTLNPDLAWTSSMSNIRNSSFPMNVRLTAAPEADAGKSGRIRFSRMAAASLDKGDKA